MNALNPVILSEWRDALLAAEKDGAVGVIVMTGSGRAYCSGLDLKVLGADDLKDGAVGPLYNEPGRAVIDIILNFSKDVIATINGVCVTGGLETLLGFDLVIAAENASFCDSRVLVKPVKLGHEPEASLGQWTDEGAGAFLHNEIFTAAEAWDMELANRVVPQEMLREETVSLANSILAKSLGNIAAIKYLYNRGIMSTLHEGSGWRQRAGLTFATRNRDWRNS